MFVSHHKGAWSGWRQIAAPVLVIALIAGFSRATFAASARPPETARELYNAGTKKLREGKLVEAQDLLRSAAGRNDESIVPSAVYNLGHARYEFGDQELKRMMGDPKSQQLTQRANRAARDAGEALQTARLALASGDTNALVEAYRRGAGARKEFRAAAKAVQEALAQFEKILTSWERASSDFRSVHELEPADTNASHNASLVDRRIAELIDMIRQQLAAMPMSGQGKNGDQQLSGAMKQIRDKLPPGMLGPDPDGDNPDEDADDSPKPGSRKEPDRGEQPISAEQAKKLLDSMQLDAQRKLFQDQQRRGKLPHRPGGDW